MRCKLFYDDTKLHMEDLAKPQNWGWAFAWEWALAWDNTVLANSAFPVRGNHLSLLQSDSTCCDVSRWYLKQVNPLAYCTSSFSSMKPVIYM